MLGSSNQSYALPQFPWQNHQSPNSDLSKAFFGKLQPTATDLPTAQAVTPAGDSDEVDLNPNADKATQLQKIIDTLNSAKDGASMSAALAQLSSFIQNNTSADYAGGVLDEISGFVDHVMDALAKDPNALGEKVSFGFAAQYSEKNYSTDSVNASNASFQFSFSYHDADTSMHADLGYGQMSKDTGHSSMRASAEYAHVSIVSFNASMKDNDALATFGKIANKLLGGDAASLLGLKDDSKNVSLMQSNRTNIVAGQTVITNLQKNFSNVSDLLGVTKDALEALQKYLEELRDRMNMEHKGEQGYCEPSNATAAAAAAAA